jgi:hypothetical protein
MGVDMTVSAWVLVVVSLRIFSVSDRSTVISGVRDDTLMIPHCVSWVLLVFSLIS